MIKTYTSDVVSNSTTSIAIVGISIFNSGVADTVASIYLKDNGGVTRSQLLEMTIVPKVTAFIDTKVFISDGDTLALDGSVDYTLAGSESETNTVVSSRSILQRV